MPDPSALADKVLNATDVAYLATCEGEQPRVRPVNVALREGWTLWVASYSAWGKVGQLRANPRVEVALTTPDGAHVRIEGEGRIREELAEKRRVLESFPLMQRYFRQASDPDYTLIEIVPTRIVVKDGWELEYRDVPLEVEA